MSERMIAEWQINAREILRVRLDVYKGRNIIDIRRWFSTGGGEHQPGRAGLTIDVRHLPALAQPVQRALADATELELLGGEAS